MDEDEQREKEKTRVNAPTVAEASDPARLGQVLEATRPPAKTEDEKADYAARLTRLEEAMRRRREKLAAGQQQ